MTIKAEQGGNDCKNQSEAKREGVAEQMIRSDSREAQGPIESEVRARESKVKPKYQKRERLTRGQSKIGEGQWIGSGGVGGDSSESGECSGSAH